MAHSSETRWQGAADAIAAASERTLQALVGAEQTYLDLFEVYQYAGASDQLMADLLFADVIEAEARAPAEANAEEVAKVADLKGAITALHDLYGALTNQVTPAEDRATALRRMS